MAEDREGQASFRNFAVARPLQVLEYSEKEADISSGRHHAGGVWGGKGRVCFDMLIGPFFFYFSCLQCF